MAGIPDPARELFDQLRDGGADEILRLLQSHDAENQWVDFKRATTDNPRSLSPDDAKQLAKCLGGFWNTDGGVVVWGIDCNDRVPPNDRTLSPGLFIEAGALQALLTRQLSRAVDPPFPGVAFASVRLPSAKEALLMYVPNRGDGLPVQVRDSGTYLFRIGESFKPIPASVLASMFGSTPPARVVAEVVALDSLYVQVRNEGRGMAFDIYVVVESTNFPNPVQNTNDWLGQNGTYVALAAHRLPPMGTMFFGNINFIRDQLPRMQRDGFSLRLRAGARHNLPSLTEYEVAANFTLPPQSGIVKVGQGELWRKVIEQGRVTKR